MESRVSSRAGRTLGLALVVCLVIALLASRRVLGSRVRVEPLTTSPAAALRPLETTEAGPDAQTGVRMALAELEAEPPPPARLTGRLQVNGYAARRGSVHLRSADGSFERALGIDAGGRFHDEELPAKPLLATFVAEGVFERELVLPDRFEFVPRAGELAVLDLDWWTRHVNVVVHSEDGLPGPARVELRGPGYDTELRVDESGLLRLELVGEGVFTFRATTPAGLVAEAELELEAGDDLDSAVLIARIKDD